MGQKVNPLGFRVAVTKNWDSKWFAGKKTFGVWLSEDAKIREFIKENYGTAAIARILIERSANRIRVTIYSARPGLLVGHKGSDIEKIKESIAKFASSKDILVDVKEVAHPDISAQLVAENVAYQLERRISFRRAMKKAISTALEQGADGVRIKCSGRLGGAELARTEQYMEGRVPLHTLKANIDYGFAEANTTAGKIGVKVWICLKKPVEEILNASDAKKSKVPQGSARK
ncbi:MAG TPA: 30S ribosomal protein S3 [Victivallales bacterium]|nr:30S ribosomal protein S3 [Victivallales bacterium]HRU00819.1 30S ribosomal protein S3 [Victivallales bacterium]